MVSVRAQPAERPLGAALVVLSGAAFGTLALFGRLAYAAGVDPPTLLFLRFSLAALVMGLFLGVRPQRVPRGRTLLTLVLMGGVGYVGQSLAYFTALTVAPASLVALLLYLYPGLVTVFSVLAFHERLHAMKVLALLVALVGMVLTIGPVGGGQPLGIVLALTSASIYAAYILVGSRLSGQAGAVASATVILPAAAVGSGVLAALHGPALPHTLEGWAAIVAIALVSTVLPIVTFFAGLGRVGPSTAAILSTVEPVVTVLLAMLFLHETMGPLQVVGGLCILGAVVALARSDAAQAREGP